MNRTQRFVLIFGPPAVGKMTTAYALAAKTNGKVFHNHLSIELLLPFFEFGSPSFSHLNELIRMRLFEEIAKSDISLFIFTLVYALDIEEDRKYVADICSIFEEKDWKVHFVELEAELQERIRRNHTEFRLSQKASKRDTESSHKRLIASEQSSHQFNSSDNFCYPQQHLKIHNTHISPEEAADRIVKHFNIPVYDNETN